MRILFVLARIAFRAGYWASFSIWACPALSREAGGVPFSCGRTASDPDLASSILASVTVGSRLIHFQPAMAMIATTTTAMMMATGVEISFFILISSRPSPRIGRGDGDRRRRGGLAGIIEIRAEQPAMTPIVPVGMSDTRWIILGFGI